MSPGMEWAWLAPAFSLAAFVIIVAAGRFLPGKGAYVAISAIAAGFAVFWLVLADYFASGRGAFSRTWFEAGGYSLKLGMVIDPLAVVMLGVVSFVALMVQVYSLGYMKDDPRFGWYFAAHALFAASMLGLVLADNLVLLYITWELVGLCSYLLIGFWYERRSAAEAAKKAFVTTRIGDVGFLIGILLLFKATGTFDLSRIFAAAHAGEISSATLTLSTLLIFSGAMGKSAQFPLHVWLPDAMEGPTPVSALIHAATMVAAGVYLVARTYPLFALSPLALNLVAAIGLFTALLAATMAIVMEDLKRVIAYSTVSKLGFMMVALGSGSMPAAIFYLTTHAFFKALLFLGAGSVLHGTGKSNIWEMGGLARRMPFTAVTFSIAALALAGLPPLSGFWSKDDILRTVFHHQPLWFFALTMLVVFLGALYAAKLIFVVFGGKPRSEVHAHEAPLSMALPMAALALLSLGAGSVALLGWGDFLYFEEPEAFHLEVALAVISSLTALGGVLAAWAIYSRGLVSPKALSERFAPVYQVVKNKYYIDDLYQMLIDKVVLAFSGLIAIFDRKVVNDRGVDGTAGFTVASGRLLRFHQTGRLYNYGLAITLGILALGVFTLIF